MFSALPPEVWLLALLAAVLVDWVCGEPLALLHPVVGMGHSLHRLGRGLVDLAPGAALVQGAVRWCVGALLWVGLALGAERALLWSLEHGLPWWGASLLLGLLLKPLFAWRMLMSEALAVEQVLRSEGLAAGRQRLGRMVSRPTGDLSEAQVLESAIESAAENASDSVLSPWLWFALLGLPGAALYRWANTADAMWGYRGAWEWAGRWAAKVDDALNWLPARATGWAIRLSAHRGAGASAYCEAGHAQRGVPWAQWPVEARKTPSPNGGWPMAATAMALGVRLSKPGVYALNEAGRTATLGDVALAVRLLNRALAMTLVLLIGLVASLSATGWFV